MIKGAVAGGLLAWTAPAIIDSLSSPAAAQSGADSVCCTITSTISYNDFNAVAAGTVLWIAAAVKEVGAQIYPITFRATTTSLTLTPPSAAAIDLTSTVPLGTVTMQNTGTCAPPTDGTNFSGGSFSTVADTNCAGNTFLTAVQYVPSAALPGHTVISWTIRIDVLTPGTTMNFNWQFFSRAFTVTPLAYNLVGVKSGDDNAFGGSDQAGYPENYKPGVIAGGSNGSLSSTQALKCPCQT